MALRTLAARLRFPLAALRRPPVSPPAGSRAVSSSPVQSEAVKKALFSDKEIGSVSVKELESYSEILEKEINGPREETLNQIYQECVDIEEHVRGMAKTYVPLAIGLCLVKWAIAEPVDPEEKLSANSTMGV